MCNVWQINVELMPLSPAGFYVNSVAVADASVLKPHALRILNASLNISHNCSISYYELPL